MRDIRLVRALLIGFSLVPTALLAQSAWTIPGIVHADGLNGTHFVSDLTVTNPGAVAAHVTLSFFPAAAPLTKVLTLDPGQTVVAADVALVHFGITSGAGGLTITSDEPLLIRAKTYNTAASGTYGVALPVVPTDRLLAPGDRADSLWITQDASATAGYRTNVAVVFPDDSGGAATVTVYDADGNARGSQDFSLDAAGLQQFAVSGFAGTVAVGRAQIAVTRGHASAYAVVVDNVTGDSSLFAFEDLPGGRQDVLVNGVARANGRNGAFFRTDGRFYNPTDTDATVTVAFHANQSANPSPASAEFVVPAGKIRDVVDVFDSLLSLPVGSAGALRFQSEWPVAILCRTSNVDPSGARPGTFGAQQKPVPFLSFTTSADAGAAVTGIRQNTAFRTNIGFAAGADGAQVTLALQNASGATVATTSASLGAFGWSQPNVQDLFPTTTIPDNATLLVKVTGGSVDVFDSSIDNLSGDPVVTPIAPLPVTIPSSATIGPAGGSIRSDDGRLMLRIPAGALSQPVGFSFQTTTSDAPQGIGPGYQILPTGITFSKNALLSLAYGRSDTDGTNAQALTVTANAGTGWFGLGGGSIDPLRHTLTVRLASTAPTPPASHEPGTLAVRRSRESVSVVWGITRSWQVSLTGPAVILTDGDTTLAASYLGPSSSTDTAETIFLPTKASDATVTWYVNGIKVGDGNVGIVGRSGVSATYTAPRCPPTPNPVAITATIASGSGFSLPFSVAGSVSVKVIPREWKLDWIVEATLQCGSDVAEVTGIHASDDVRWSGPETTITFSLNSPTLSVIDPVRQITSLPSHSLKACRCFGSSPAIRQYGTDSPLAVPFGAIWDVANDRMHLNVAPSYTYEGGVVTCVPQGSSQSFDNGDLVQGWAFDQDLELRSGDQGTVTPSATRGEDWTFSVRYYLRSVCP